MGFFSSVPIGTFSDAMVEVGCSQTDGRTKLMEDQNDAGSTFVLQQDMFNYRPRSEGDNALGSVRLSVCLSVRL